MVIANWPRYNEMHITANPPVLAADELLVENDISLTHRSSLRTGRQKEYGWQLTSANYTTFSGSSSSAINVNRETLTARRARPRMQYQAEVRKKEVGPRNPGDQRFKTTPSNEL